MAFLVHTCQYPSSSSLCFQVVLINALQQLCEAPSPEEGGAFLVIAGNLLKWLYDSDVVGEEAVLAWAGTGEGGAGGAGLGRNR